MVITVEQSTMKSCKRTKSDSVLYNAETSLFSESPDCDDHCDTECTGTDAHSFPLDDDHCTTSSDVCSDNSQYVALDCEFVGVGPRLLSALGITSDI